jgi:poly(3-hydroxybutyrate) depolymerase
MKRLFAILMAVVTFQAATASAGETVIKDAQGMDCFVYTPDPVDPNTIYQLVVGVHGAGGKGNGAAGMKDWAKRGDVIVIGPSFVSNGENPYQNGNGVHAEKLIALFAAVNKDHKLRDKVFLHGFSGGAQFVHRFAMLHPELVCGVSAHSAGTWSTDGYGQVNPAARAFPFAISCGEKDDKKSFPEAPFTRIEWYGRFQNALDSTGFAYVGGTWPGVGHSMCPEAWSLAKQCFQLGTGLPGESATEEVAISDAWKNLKVNPKVNSKKVPPKKAPPPARPVSSR